MPECFRLFLDHVENIFVEKFVLQQKYMEFLSL